MKIKYTLLAAVIGMGAAMSASAFSWTGFGADTLGPQYIITWDGTSFNIINGPGLAQGAYDGVEDTYFGVENLSTSQTLNSVNLTSALQIFFFDGDGIDTYGAIKVASNPDISGYGGPITYFTGVNGAFDAFGNATGVGSYTSGTANFFGGIAPGGSTYFSLEENTGLNGGSGSGVTVGGVPDGGSTMLLLGSALAGLGALRRRFAV